MRKYIILTLTLMTLFTLGGCKTIKNWKHAGTYELYSMTGDLSLNDFEYYRITLEKNGDCLIESKSKIGGVEYSAEATYEINDDIIKIYTKTATATLTETFDFIDGEIHMVNQVISGISYTAKLRKND